MGNSAPVIFLIHSTSTCAARDSALTAASARFLPRGKFAGAGGSAGASVMMVAPGWPSLTSVRSARADPAVIIKAAAVRRRDAFTGVGEHLLQTGERQAGN